MRGIAGHLLFGLFFLLMFAACSKQPVQEIASTKSAVDSAMAEGAEKYSPSEAKKVNDALASALNEVKMEDGKFIKDYKKAREMLAVVKADAENLKAGLAAKKDAAKKKAIVAEESAVTSVGEAKASLTKAMKSTKTKLDIEALSNDIRGLDDSLAEIKKLIDTEDYNAAIEKAGALREKASEMAKQQDEIVRQSTMRPAKKKK